MKILKIQMPYGEIELSKREIKKWFKLIVLSQKGKRVERFDGADWIYDKTPSFGYRGTYRIAPNQEGKELVMGGKSWVDPKEFVKKKETFNGGTLKPNAKNPKDKLEDIENQYIPYQCGCNCTG